MATILKGSREALQNVQAATQENVKNSAKHAASSASGSIDPR